MLRAICLVGAMMVGVPSNPASQVPAWLGHYQDGERQMEQRQYQDAALSFMKAIRVKERDNERERISGTRVVAYFPRRELGIALMQLGIRDFALEELKLSNEQSPSARAQMALRELER